jgi:hypothetical protein
LAAQQLGEENIPWTTRPPNLKESSDYNKEPLAPRCFNCAYVHEKNLEFYCSKFVFKTKVYELCDAWKSNQQREFPLAFVSQTNDGRVQKIVDEDYEPLLLISKGKISHGKFIRLGFFISNYTACILAIAIWH